MNKISRRLTSKKRVIFEYLIQQIEDTDAALLYHIRQFHLGFPHAPARALVADG